MGFLFRDNGSPLILRRCPPLPGLVTPATRPGRRPVAIGDQKSDSVGIVIVLLLLFLLPVPAPRFALATPFGLHPASVLARLAAGAGAAGGALDLPLADRLHGLQWRQGCGFAHVLTRSVLAVPAALRVRPPGVPLTPLPLEKPGQRGTDCTFFSMGWG